MADQLFQVSVQDQKFVTACCCETCSPCMTEPLYCGGYQKGECLCIEGEGGCQLKKPRTCVQVNEVCLCIEYRCAFPCHDEVPFGIGLCGFFCLPFKK